MLQVALCRWMSYGSWTPPAVSIAPGRSLARACTKLADVCTVGAIFCRLHFILSQKKAAIAAAWSEDSRGRGTPGGSVTRRMFYRTANVTTAKRKQILFELDHAQNQCDIDDMRDCDARVKDVSKQYLHKVAALDHALVYVDVKSLSADQ